MRKRYPSLGGPIFYGAALVVLSSPSWAEVSRFYDDGLTGPFIVALESGVGLDFLGLESYQVVDIYKFYDEGLTGYVDVATTEYQLPEITYDQLYKIELAQPFVLSPSGM